MNLFGLEFHRGTSIEGIQVLGKIWREKRHKPFTARSKRKHRNTHTHTHTCMHSPSHLNTSPHKHTYKRAHTNAHLAGVHTHAGIYTPHTHKRTRTCTHASRRTHVHMHTRLHKHTNRHINPTPRRDHSLPSEAPPGHRVESRQPGTELHRSSVGRGLLWADGVYRSIFKKCIVPLFFSERGKNLRPLKGKLIKKKNRNRGKM